MRFTQDIEDYHGESRADIRQGEEESQRAEALRGISWDILDLIPEDKIREVKEIIIDMIIEEGWDL